MIVAPASSACSQLVAVVNLDEDLEAAVARSGEQVGEVVADEPGDQQDDVALDGVELRFGDEEVLPEDGHIDRLAHAFERVGAPAEVRRLGEHAQRGRAAGDHSPRASATGRLAGALRRRAGGFHLGDQRDAPVRLGGGRTPPADRAVRRRPRRIGPRSRGCVQPTGSI